MKITLRSGHEGDQQATAVVLVEAFREIAEKHGFAPDYTSSQEVEPMMAALLTDSDIYSVVAEDDLGVTLGSNFLWEYYPIAGIGPTTVSPGVQHRGIGRLMMEDLLKRAKNRDFAGVRLVQETHNARSLALYAKLGFVVREVLATLSFQPLNLSMAGCEVLPVTPDDFNACNNVCWHVHGHDRRRELESAMQSNTACLVVRDGRITGYATGITELGHAVGYANIDVMALIANAKEPSTFLAPMRNAELFAWCL